MPAFALKELFFKFAQLALGCAHQIAGLAFADKGDVLLADHAAAERSETNCLWQPRRGGAAATSIHDPHAFGLTAFVVHDGDDFLHGGDVGAVAGEDFKRQRQAFRGAGQADADLLAVAAPVAAVTAGGLVIVFGLPFEERAGDVIEKSRAQRDRLP